MAQDKLNKRNLDSRQKAEHFDIIIIGAGLSGIGSAYHLIRECPGKTYAILDAKDCSGGTWETHRYPGVRCDADMALYGYEFKPWGGTTYASGEEILNYMRGVAKENNIDRHMRYNHQVLSLNWSSEKNCWTVDVLLKDSNRKIQYTCSYIWACPGFHRHEKGHIPKFEGIETFKGIFAHSQHWPRDLSYKGKKVVVIGSGATAASMVPALAKEAAHVIMLQRSPSYYWIAPRENPFQKLLREQKLDETLVNEFTRRKIVNDRIKMVQRTKTEPEAIRKELMEEVRKVLGEKFDEKHYSPKYRVWQQRLCIVPDGDLFKAIKDEKVTVMTDQIERFTPKGILLKSGQEIEADIVAAATGLNFNVMGDIECYVDDKKVDYSKTVFYHKMMITGIPNLFHVWAYYKAPWTPRVHLIANFVCRLLNHMDAKKHRSVTVRLRPEDKGMNLETFITPQEYNSNYIQRDIDKFPRVGDRGPWTNTQDCEQDEKDVRSINLEDSVFVYSSGVAAKRSKAA